MAKATATAKDHIRVYIVPADNKCIFRIIES